MTIFSRWWKREAPERNNPCGSEEHKQEMEQLKQREEEASRRIDALTLLAEKLRSEQ